MSPSHVATRAVQAFACLGDACPDTCCKGWGMQLSREHVQKLRSEAPELLEAVVEGGESEFVMKRDAATGYCVKLDAGLCSIHRDYGSDFLGDACDHYPRSTRALSDTLLTNLALSCPEAARLMLFSDDAFALSVPQPMRVPFMLNNYLPAGLTPMAAVEIHQSLLALAGDAQASAERNAMRLMMVARALAVQPLDAWAHATGFYITMADGRLPTAEPHPNDLIHAAQALAGLVAASSAQNHAGLGAILQAMQQALGITIDSATAALTVGPHAMECGVRLLNQWGQGPHQVMQPVLRRYLQAQLAQALFPFGGLGETLADRMTIIAVRLATIKLALMAQAQLQGGTPDEVDVVRIVYTISRCLDHLADPAMSMAMYGELGWVRDARLRGLLGDA